MFLLCRQATQVYKTHPAKAAMDLVNVIIIFIVQKTPHLRPGVPIAIGMPKLSPASRWVGLMVDVVLFKYKNTKRDA